MIFVTVGTQLPFDRLVRGVDVWAGHHPQIEVVAQIGRLQPGGYIPQHMTAQPSFAPQDFNHMFKAADLVIAHAGTGSLLEAQKTATPILVMPRRHHLGEHRNDHQMATANHFRTRPGVRIVEDETDLGSAIDAILSSEPETPDFGASADRTLIEAVRKIIFPGGQDQ